MRSDLVEVDQPRSGGLACLIQGQKAMQIEELVSSLPLNDSTWAFCVGLPGSMKCSSICALRPSAASRGSLVLIRYRISGFSVVRAQRRSLENADHAATAEAAFDVDGQAFAGEVVDDHQHAQPPATGERVVHEVKDQRSLGA